MQIKDLIHKFTSDLPAQPRAKVPDRSDGYRVILTGSTGALGSYILSSLLKDNSISRVFCLNRSKDGESKQIDSFKQKGLSSNLLATPKVEFLQIDLANENLGLPQSAYTTLLNQVDTIIHNAWEVNWLLPLEMFQDTHIKGVRSLVDFALQSPHNPHILFVSSVSTFYRWGDRYSTPVPESFIEDWETCLEFGYAQSKYVSESVLEIASSRCGLKSTILRIGQIAGPTTVDGMWSLADVLPTVFATSIALGQMPMMEGEIGSINWVPCDLAGEIVTEIVRHRQQKRDPPEFAVHNVVNPTPTPWLDLASTMQEMYPLRLVSMSSWLKALKQVAISNKDSNLYPAFPLIPRLDVWLGDGKIELMQIETSHTCAASPTLNTLPPVGREWMLNWLRQWDLFPELVLYG